MTQTLTEKIDSRMWTTGESASIVLKYTLEGDGLHDDTFAYAAVAASTATSYNGLDRVEIELEPSFVDTVTSFGRWNVTVKYGRQQSPAETGQFSTSFKTSGGTTHLTQSFGTTAYAPSGKTAPACSDAIGVSQNGDSVQVDGVDVIIPVYTWAETHMLASINPQAYYALTGKTNNGSFRGFAAGEVLLQGVSGSKRGIGQWEITFEFAASPNRTNIAVGPITVASKKGWEYLWVRYADDVSAGHLVKTPIGAYVAKVYSDGDFATLGIGTT